MLARVVVHTSIQLARIHTLLGAVPQVGGATNGLYPKNGLNCCSVAAKPELSLGKFDTSPSSTRPDICEHETNLDRLCTALVDPRILTTS